MQEKKKNIEFIDEKEDKPTENLHLLRGLVDGTLITRSFFTRQMPFFLFLAFLGIIYISNRYHSDSTRNNVFRLKNELLELRSEALYTASELMRMGRQTEVAREVRNRGLDLKESMEPPKKIKTR
jgi:hypothetical protein